MLMFMDILILAVLRIFLVQWQELLQLLTSRTNIASAAMSTITGCIGVFIQQKIIALELLNEINFS